MIPSRPLTPEEAREVHYFYHMAIELAVKIDLCPNDAQREHLIQLLLEAVDDSEPEALLLRAVINYVRVTA